MNNSIVITDDGEIVINDSMSPELKEAIARYNAFAKDTTDDENLDRDYEVEDMEDAALEENEPINENDLSDLNNMFL